jgi:prolipoprotein diacylglyceryltransferase
VCRIAAPLAPLVTEEVWRGLTGGESVHLTDWPDATEFPEDDALVMAKTPEAYDAAKHLHTMVYTGDPEAIKQIATMVPAHYPNNFIQAITDGPLLMLLLVIVWWKPRRAGTLSAAFLIGYGVLRNVSEVYREPDDGVFFVGPLTTPILVSMLMVVLGITVLALRKPDAPMLGGVRPRAA